MKKKLLVLILSMMLASMCIGCGAGSTTTDTAASATTEENTPAQTTEPVATPAETAEPTPEATEAPTPEPTEEPTPEPTAAPTEAPTPEPTVESTPEPTPEPVPEPQVVYTYTDMTATMYATQTVNVRNLPGTDGEKMGSLSTNQEVAVTGQCNETGWYRFNYNGQTAFVSDKYLSTEMVEVAPPAPETSTTTSNSEPFPYQLHVMYYDNMGYPYYYYIGLNKLYISPEDDAKNMACQDAQSNYVFENFQSPVYDPITNTTTVCSFNPYWGPVGSYQSDGKPIYVQYIYECNGVVLPTPEERGIFTAGLGW
ncbi:MAG: SH3 domain-containing protein [Lachnospiraceae bacterium]|nr:SH3 domain-containing protein [Lachnospiraceae bacterium]